MSIFVRYNKKLQLDMKFFAIVSLWAALSVGGSGEILNNRDFENKEDHMAGWTVSNGRSAIEDEAPVHPANPYYLTVYTAAGTAVSNDCKGNFSVRKGEIFDFNIHIKASKKGKMVVFIIDGEGNVIGGNTIRVREGGWYSYSSSIQAGKASDNCTIDIVPPMGKVSIDAASMVSRDNYR